MEWLESSDIETTVRHESHYLVTLKAAAFMICVNINSRAHQKLKVQGVQEETKFVNIMYYSVL